MFNIKSQLLMLRSKNIIAQNRRKVINKNRTINDTNDETSKCIKKLL